MKKLLFTFFILLAPTLASAATIGKVNANNIGLIGYWTFDGADVSPTVADKSGSGNNGYFIGLATTSAEVPGKIGQAFRFNGSSTYVPVTTSNLPTGAAPHTVSVWVKNRQNSGVQYITEWGNLAETGDPSLLVIGGNWRWSVFGNASVDVSSANDVGNWTHLVGTFDGTSGRLYRNGIQVGTNAFSPTPSAQNLSIGRRFTSTDYFDGLIDDVRIYNRSLSLSEVKALYNSGSAKVAQSATVASSSPLSNGLAGYWTLDGSQTNWTTGKTNDMSGRGNPGQLVSLSTSTTPIIGKIGQAMQFFTGSGSSPRIVVGSSVLGASMPNGYAVGGWYKAATTADQYLLERAGSDAPSIHVVGGSISCITLANGSQLALSATISNTTDGNWHHVVCNFNAPQNRGEVYFDGVMRATAAKTNLDILPSGATFAFPSRGGLFAGVDDIRAYERALTAQEVQQLYKLGENKIAQSQTNSSTNGLIGYWTMDGPKIDWAKGKVIDSSGQGNNAQISPGLSTTSSTGIGKIGQALNFNQQQAASQNIIFPTITSGTTYTYAAWIRPNETLFGSFGALFMQADGQAGVLYTKGSHKIGLFYSSVVHNQNTTLTDNQWVHYAAVVSNGNAQYYINGVPDGSSANVVSINFAEMGDEANGDRYKGLLDDVRFYNRALGAQEVQQLYNMGK